MEGCFSILQVDLYAKIFSNIISRIYYLRWINLRSSLFAASYLSDVLASIAPVSGAPLLGFNNIPNKPISVIDFHGTDDSIIPFNLNRYSANSGQKKEIIYE